MLEKAMDQSQSDHSQAGNTFRLVGENRYVLTNLVYEKENQTIWDVPPNCLMRQIPLHAVTESLLHEIKITQSLTHPNIIKIFDHFQERGNLYILKEKCDGRIQVDYENAQKFSQQLDDMIKQILTALNYIQNLKIIHRNLKTSTIYTNDGVCKLKGFGYSVILDDDNDFVQGDPHQPTDQDFYYRSPQMLKGQKYGLKSDLWSLGIILYELIYGRLPWQAETKEEYIKAITEQPLRIPYDCKFSPILKQMLELHEIDRCEWDILYQSVGLYVDDKDVTQRLSLMISLTNLGKQAEALQVLEEEMSNLGEFPDDEFDGEDNLNPLFMLGIFFLLIY